MNKSTYRIVCKVAECFAQRLQHLSLLFFSALVVVTTLIQWIGLFGYLGVIKMYFWQSPCKFNNSLGILYQMVAFISFCFGLVLKLFSNHTWIALVSGRLEVVFVQLIHSD